jgi:hypothetical protein
MRKLASFLFIGFALTAGAAETWRWKDANGVVHYSDRPEPGAERVDIVLASKTTGNAPTAASGTANQNGTQNDVVSIPYTKCVIASPDKDQVFNAVNTVPATVQLEPELQNGHRLQVMLNGRIYTDWPEGVMNYTLSNLYRGSYTLTARVLDANGATVCTGATITFHVRLPSLLAPARPQQNPRKP